MRAMADGLSHVDVHGRARMVDVTQKANTHRQAVARCTLSSSSGAIASMGSAQQADVLAAARIIGIQAAKETPDLIPLCHPILIGDVTIDFEVADDKVEIVARVESFGQTGVEMEALTACAAAALAICDQCRDADPSMTVHQLRVWEKRGGRSGTWRYDGADLGASGG
jgi:cyclic pyranopterin monophosphate synthase